jgi:hypothetical protein
MLFFQTPHRQRLWSRSSLCSPLSHPDCRPGPQQLAQPWPIHLLVPNHAPFVPGLDMTVASSQTKIIFNERRAPGLGLDKRAVIASPHDRSRHRTARSLPRSPRCPF